MTCLAPNERLSGSPQAQHELLGRLTTLRASLDLNHHHSELSFTTLSDVLRHSAAPEPASGPNALWREHGIDTVLSDERNVRA
jgi:hypothetical protein